ncbi:O-antigen ligase-like membrane protein [Hydrogenispora ethanolica]|uniref:O-antigen ligase-like membrane protein n=1 Tax=Hydrogenispora ethanolica TaxID=1082276 RepID=A0A4R1SB39_HYDET|nr:O-antigen ligase family protein [Hydrogenispora ethanolica]TCL76753.1 O-antigen ligase-like membrane protein [Hydrogenispora ethanolica]
MLTNLLCAALGMIAGYKNRAHLLYLYLILYPFDGAVLNGTGITVFHVISYGVLAPLILYLGYDLLTLGKNDERARFATVSLSLGLLYIYIFCRYLAALNPKRDSYFLVLTSGFVLIFGVLYYYRQLQTGRIIQIFRLLILVELAVVARQALFGAEPGLVLGVFDFSRMEPKVILAEDYYRATGTFQDPNYYALYLAAISSFLMLRFSWLNAGVGWLGIIGVLLSFSRMGVLLSGVLSVYWLIRLVKSRHPRKYLGLWFAVPLLAALVLQLVVHFPLQARFGLEQAVGAVQARFGAGDDFDVGGRGFIVDAYFRSMLKFSNVFLGLGFLNFQMVLEEVAGVNLVAHNEYLQIFADLGLAGWLMIGLILYQLFQHAQSRGASAPNPYAFPVAVILLGNLFLSTTLYNYVYFFYALYGAFALYRQRDQGRELPEVKPWAIQPRGSAARCAGRRFFSW